MPPAPRGLRLMYRPILFSMTPGPRLGHVKSIRQRSGLRPRNTSGAGRLSRRVSDAWDDTQRDGRVQGPGPEEVPVPSGDPRGVPPPAAGAPAGCTMRIGP